MNILSGQALLLVYTKIGLNLLRLELIEAYGTGILKMKEAYSGTGKEPKIEISDNAFKIILPNLNVNTDQEKELEISQTACGRLLRRMIERKQIVQEGKGKNTHYRISE